jgi:exosortase
MTRLPTRSSGGSVERESAGNHFPMLMRRHVFFVLFIFLSAFFFEEALRALVSYSVHDQSGSHIVLIPFISIFLIYSERDRIFADTRNSFGFGAALILAATFLYWLAERNILLGGGRQWLSLATLLVVWTWIAGFLACYGSRAFRAAIFPLFFLLLMIPLPDAVMAQTIHLMQQGTAAVTLLIFRIVGVPVLRQGFVFSVPGFTIEIAAECSGIRSSIALFITALLAAHFVLRTRWKMFLLVALTFPLAVIKNGIRVATLTLLSIYVNPGFLFGSLHRDGGFVFFFLALAMLAPVLLLLQRSEQPRAAGVVSREHGHQQVVWDGSRDAMADADTAGSSAKPT